MGSNPKIVMVRANKLTAADLKFINSTRREKLHSDYDIKPEKGNEAWTQLWFFLKDKEQILAFGRFYNIQITFLEKQYDVLGIASIISVIERHKFGRQLLEEMKKYIEKSGKIGLGFCNKDITPFYKKCGFIIMIGGQIRFYHPKGISENLAGDAFYFPFENELMTAMDQHKGITAQISRPHW